MKRRLLISFLIPNFIWAFETSFGKSIRNGILLDQYPIIGEAKWGVPIEKEAEFNSLKNLAEKRKRLTDEFYLEGN